MYRHFWDFLKADLRRDEAKISFAKLMPGGLAFSAICIL
jgi:hypothetical protein